MYVALYQLYPLDSFRPMMPLEAEACDHLLGISYTHNQHWHVHSSHRSMNLLKKQNRSHLNHFDLEA